MIVSHPGRWFIATPTKTGTHTLEAIASRPANADYLELAGPPPGDHRRRMHRMAPDPTWSGYRGCLLVRNPWSRWVSVYEYLRAPKFYAQWGAREVQGRTWGGTKNPAVLARLGNPMTFEDFLTWMLRQRAEHYTPKALARRGSAATSMAYRSPWIWTDSLTVSRRLVAANLGEPPTLIHLEQMADDLQALVGDVPDLDLHADQLNRTTDPTHTRWTAYWSDVALALARRLGIDQEADDLGYLRSPA